MGNFLFSVFFSVFSGLLLMHEGGEMPGVKIIFDNKEGGQEVVPEIAQEREISVSYLERGRKVRALLHVPQAVRWGRSEEAQEVPLGTLGVHRGAAGQHEPQRGEVGGPAGCSVGCTLKNKIQHKRYKKNAYKK